MTGNKNEKAARPEIPLSCTYSEYNFGITITISNTIIIIMIIIITIDFTTLSL